MSSERALVNETLNLLQSVSVVDGAVAEGGKVVGMMDVETGVEMHAGCLQDEEAELGFLSGFGHNSQSSKRWVFL